MALGLGATPAQAQITFAADLGSNEADSTSATSLTLTTTATAPAGASVIVIALDQRSSGVVGTSAACTDSAGHTFTTDVFRTDGQASASICATHQIAGALASGSTITVTWSGGSGAQQGLRVRAFAVTGLAGSPLDQTASNNGFSSAPSSGTAAATSQANELLVGAFTDGNDAAAGAGFSPGSGYTALAGVGTSQNPSLFGEYRIVAATGTYDASGTFGGNKPWLALLATYRGASADLSITKTDGVTTVAPGGAVTYTITASNAGPGNATGATVADTFPAILTGVTWTCVGAGGGTCTAAGAGNINDAVNLPAGGSVTYTVSATVDPSAVGTLTNTATVAAPGGVTDPNPANNSATDSDTISAPPPAVTFSGPSATGTGTITASFAGGGAGCTFSGPQFIGPPPGAPPIPPVAPGDVTFPHGLFDFSTTSCTVGSTLTFTIVYPQPLNPGTRYWKYGPTSANVTPHWYVLNAAIAGYTATFTITDGGLGDDDLTANGTIVDQGGPGLGGTSIPTLDPRMLVLLLLMMAGVAAVALKRRR